MKVVIRVVVGNDVGARCGQAGHGIEQARQMSDSVGVFYGIVLATALVLICNGALSATRTITVKGQ